MKTPRQILLESIQDEELDRIRLQALDVAFQNHRQHVKAGLWTTFQAEWVRPFRWYWSTLTAGWSITLILNLASPPGSAPSSSMASTRQPEIPPEWSEYTQRTLLARFYQEEDWIAFRNSEEEEESNGNEKSDLNQPPGPQSRLNPKTYAWT